MPRADRGMAQRFAAKRRKRRAAGPRPAAAGGAVRREPADQEGSAEAASPPLERSPGRPAPVSRTALPTVRVGSSSTRARPAVRPYSSYTQEYSYVLGDLRRVIAVGGGLLLGLIVLAFFVR